MREFRNEVLPLLDGRHTVAEIKSLVGGILSAAKVDAALGLLEEQRLLIADFPGRGSALARLAPQLNFFHELGLASHETQERLSRAKVSVLGLGGLGSLIAMGLASAGVGQLELVDDRPVRDSDRLSPVFGSGDLGGSRAGPCGGRRSKRVSERSS